MPLTALTALTKKSCDPLASKGVLNVHVPSEWTVVEPIDRSPSNTVMTSPAWPKPIIVGSGFLMVVACANLPCDPRVESLIPAIEGAPALTGVS